MSVAALPGSSPSTPDPRFLFFLFHSRHLGFRGTGAGPKRGLSDGETLPLPLPSCHLTLLFPCPLQLL